MARRRGGRPRAGAAAPGGMGVDFEAAAAAVAEEDAFASPVPVACVADVRRALRAFVLRVHPDVLQVRPRICTCVYIRICICV